MPSTQLQTESQRVIKILVLRAHIKTTAVQILNEAGQGSKLNLEMIGQPVLQFCFQLLVCVSFQTSTKVLHTHFLHNKKKKNCDSQQTHRKRGKNTKISKKLFFFVLNVHHYYCGSTLKKPTMLFNKQNLLSNNQKHFLKCVVFCIKCTILL